MKRVGRPWGNYESLDSSNGYQVKRLVVNPGGQLSLQSHEHRDEIWTVVKGKPTVTRGEEQIVLNVSEHIFIPKTIKHRIENFTDSEVIIIEVQVGSYLGEDSLADLGEDSLADLGEDSLADLGEDDIVRYSDVYGRN